MVMAVGLVAVGNGDPEREKFHPGNLFYYSFLMCKYTVHSTNCRKIYNWVEEGPCLGGISISFENRSLELSYMYGVSYSSITNHFPFFSADDDSLSSSSFLVIIVMMTMISSLNLSRRPAHHCFIDTRTNMQIWAILTSSLNQIKCYPTVIMIYACLVSCPLGVRGGRSKWMNADCYCYNVYFAIFTRSIGN